MGDLLTGPPGTIDPHNSGTLDAIARAASARQSREERAASIAGLIRESENFRWVGLYDVEDDEIVNIAWSGPGPPTHLRFPRSHGLSGAAVTAAETVVSADVARDPRYLTAFTDTGSEIIVPVSVDGAIRGTIDVESEAVGAFGPDEQMFLEQWATAASPLWR
jgi:L-methionine (R)-S-oxide reductase